MKHFAMTLDLKDDLEAVRKYAEYHRNVWPEVKAALRDVGIRKMRIFLKGRRLFMYCEAVDAFDPARDFQRYLQSERVREWDRLMRAFQTPAPEAAPGEWWSQMEEVFDMAWRPGKGDA